MFHPYFRIETKGLGQKAIAKFVHLHRLPVQTDALMSIVGEDLMARVPGLGLKVLGHAVYGPYWIVRLLNTFY